MTCSLNCFSLYFTDCLWGKTMPRSRGYKSDDCGWEGIDEQTCNCMGCCFSNDPGDWYLWCWYREEPNTIATTITMDPHME
jgi:hypothetical protein